MGVILLAAALAVLVVSTIWAANAMNEYIALKRVELS